ncbi:G3E family GTPase [Kribbella sp. VKM Ac-2527]|uniref:G3E family GTPase n=1 Tax=Kribbella caucasensis TaxID=2512215 RepID=A0A4R6KQX9_9ACTN|nr:GTP-binding protein [Kribbella sp. VKM Ac-2527]TDO54544.1 G3E family GTPase [Kribbella sp. VKM Ac-2527]
MLPVTLVAGVGETTRGTVAGTLLGPGTVLVEYDVSGLAGGTVIRIARTTSAVIDREVIRMGHPCISCAMRGSLVPLLVSIAAVERYRSVIVSIPGAGDTQALAEEIARDASKDLRVDAVLAVIDPSSFVADVSGDELLRDSGVATAAEDGRALAEAIIRQLEYADAVVLSEPDETARALAQAINPQALVRTGDEAVELVGVRLHDPDAAETRVEPGSISAPLVEEAGPVRTLVWQSDRPFHPERLYDALEDLVAGTARGKGTVWLASQPRARLGWDNFGTNIAIGVLGRWLVDLSADRWSEVSQTHQARSALEWHPEHGDRASYLSITGVGLDLWELRRRLDGCVLRADEPAETLTDPFAPYLEGSTAA